jgi:D-alanyl-D-alanine dipeptidase
MAAKRQTFFLRAACALAGLLLFSPLAHAGSGPEVALVDIESVNPHIRLDIRYATANNFTRQVLYPKAKCYLRKPVAERLSEVQARLEGMSRGLRVFDCYRPLSVQKRMWALVPDERYVADPAKGSRHNRGAAVDVTLVGPDGKDLDMPTPYDDFTEKAHGDYMNLPAAVIANRALLELVMKRAGFEPLPTEWWHFDAVGWESYGILDVDFDRLEPAGTARPPQPSPTAAGASSALE